MTTLKIGDLDISDQLRIAFLDEIEQKAKRLGRRRISREFFITIVGIDFVKGVQDVLNVFLLGALLGGF